MQAYIIRRLLLVIPTLLLASIIIFLVVRLIPGDVVDAMVASAGKSVSGVSRAAIEHQLGLDVPIFTQYGRWIGVVPGDDGGFSGILQGNLGDSLWKRSPVVDDILARWPVTLELGILGLIISQIIALPIGLYSAIRQDTAGDYIGRSFAILCISVPGFWLGTMVIVFPSLWWNYMPPLSLISFTEDPIGNLQMFIVPSIVLGMWLSGVTMRMLRANMLEVLRQDYIRTGWSKGLKERVVVVRHALKNALIPVITLVGLQLVVMIGGTVIIEQIFCLPGVGRLLLNACLKRDYTMISGVLLFVGAGMVVLNLLVDLTYAYLDPRVRLK